MSTASRRPVAAAATAVAWAVALWIIWISVRWGRDLQRSTPEVLLGAAPLVGRKSRDGWDWRFAWSLVGAGAIAFALSVSCWRGWWFQLRLRWVALAAAIGSMAFATLLALTDGADGILYGAEHTTEYVANLPITPPAGEFVRTFTARLHEYSVHIRGHPPGFVLVLELLEWIGIGGGWSTAMLSVLGTGLLAVGVLVVVLQLAGAEWMRRAAPFLVVSPYLIWMITSADAVFTGVAALGIAAIAVGIARRRPVAALLGLAGGVVLGGVMFATYLGAVLLIVPGALVIHGLWRRRPGAVPAAAGALFGGLVVTVAFRLAGFWWLDGASATRDEYWAGTAQFRTWGYFGLANLAAALIALGPTAFAGILRLRDRRMWLVVGAAVTALLVSHLSQYTRGEVERIWLLFYPWIAVAGASLFVPRVVVAGESAADNGVRFVVRQHRAAIWLAAQAMGAIALQAALVTKW